MTLATVLLLLPLSAQVQPVPCTGVTITPAPNSVLVVVDNVPEGCSWAVKPILPNIECNGCCTAPCYWEGSVNVIPPQNPAKGEKFNGYVWDGNNWVKLTYTSNLGNPFDEAAKRAAKETDSVDGPPVIIQGLGDNSTKALSWTTAVKPEQSLHYSCDFVWDGKTKALVSLADHPKGCEEFHPPLTGEIFHRLEDQVTVISWEDAAKRADETYGKPKGPLVTTNNHIEGESMRPAEPIDVPAIEYTIPASHPCNLPTFSGSDCLTGPETHYKCEDTSRILLISEDEKHWCHKVQNDLPPSNR